MENAMSFEISPLQLLFATAFQIWLIVFPIILLRKVNYLTALLHSHIYPADEDQA